jgi:hypothetical protein
MKNYIVADYQNWDDLQADLTAELNSLVNLPIEVEHIKYGKGVITSLTVGENNSPSGSSFHIMGNIDFYFDSPHMFAIDLMLNSKKLFVAEPENSTIIDFAANLQTLYLEVKTERAIRATAEYEAKQQAKELAKQEAKLQARMEKDIQDFTAMTRETRPQSATGEFYHALGWLAKNAGAISATIPDYILPYFENRFGTDYTPTVIDSKKRTVNGHSMQWASSMKVALPKKAQESVPAVFLDYLSSNKASLASTSLVYDLVANYGFQFGKTQDVDKIRDSIPTEYLEPFEKGYAE